MSGSYAISARGCYKVSLARCHPQAGPESLRQWEQIQSEAYNADFTNVALFWGDHHCSHVGS